MLEDVTARLQSRVDGAGLDASVVLAVSDGGVLRGSFLLPGRDAEFHDLWRADGESALTAAVETLRAKIG